VRPAGARDLRAPAIGLAAWSGGLLALTAPGWLTIALALLVLGLTCWLRGEARRTVAAWLLVAAAVGGCASLRDAAVRTGPVAGLATGRAAVEARLTITSDPVRLDGAFGTGVRVRATITELTARGARQRVHAPVLVFGSADWASVQLGGVVDVQGRLAPSDGHDLSAVLTARGSPAEVQEPGPLWRASARLREEIRGAVSGRPAKERALVPALVDGDDSGLDEQVQADFRTAGLTHLLAVSGTNLTLVVGFLVVIGRWCGVRGRWLLLLGALGIAGFVLLARTEPSVVRAAAMGAVALLGLGSNGSDRGSRALGAALVVLLLWDPWLATSVGFALSVLATGGILFLAPVWRDALNRWLPDWIATAVAVPAAAQLVCTPVVAAISGQVSLVAIAANLLAGPLVAPATVCGLAGGLAGLLWDPAGRVLGWIACSAASGIITVAEHSAALTMPAVDWGTSWVAIVVLTLLCAGIALAAPAVLARRSAASACCALLCLIVLVPLPSPGWPPSGWVLAVCDVGQGDALVVNAGPGSAVVVDAGPEPALVDRCLDRLDVDVVPLVVLTHFHADHVDGLPGVYDGRRVGEVDVTSLAEPVARVEAVEHGTGGRTRIPGYGEVRTIGQLTLQVLGPVPGFTPHGDAADEGSGPNNASVVLLVEVRGLRLLLTGDVEPEAQAALARSLPGLSVDVLKIPHHGSRYQDLDFLTSLGARVAIASVGEGNDYGHPAEETLGALSAAGAQVHRTDTEGDVVVVLDGGSLRVETRD
jgi:competence protein ComEC